MKTVTVKLTLPQLWLIVEQMDKGAAAWDLSKFNAIAERISKKLRVAALRSGPIALRVRTDGRRVVMAALMKDEQENKNEN